MKNIKVNVSIENSVEVYSYLVDFSGNVEQWKEAVYDLFRADMTWNFAYRIEVKEGRKGVFVRLIIKTAFEKNVVEFMADKGFGNLKVIKGQIGVLDCCDTELEYIEVDW